MNNRVMTFCAASFVLGGVIGIGLLTCTVLREADESIEALEKRIAALEGRVIGSRGNIVLTAPALTRYPIWPLNPVPRQLPRGAIPFEFNGVTYYNVPLARNTP